MIFELKSVNKKIFQEILLLGLNECNYILLITRNLLGRSIKLESLLKELKINWIAEKEVTHWPGTTIDSDIAKMYIYSYDNFVLSTLLKYGPNQNDWIQPNLPEDICLMRDYEKKWFFSITHENAFAFDISDDEKRELELKIPNLKFEEK
jgi:hypothetical protein